MRPLEGAMLVCAIGLCMFGVLVLYSSAHYYNTVPVVDDSPYYYYYSLSSLNTTISHGPINLRLTTSNSKSNDNLILNENDDDSTSLMMNNNENNDRLSIVIDRNNSVFEDSDTSTSSSSPNNKELKTIRMQRQFKVSPVCQPSLDKHGPTTIKRIYFAHMRKAGGTTLRNYLNKVVQKYNLKYFPREGRPFEYPGSRRNTLYVTHLRDPVSRMISHYKYSGRWDCKQLVNNKTLFYPTQENALRLEDWLARYEQGYPPIIGNLRGSCGECASNCYIQWLNLMSTEEFCYPEEHEVEAKRFEMARKKAYGYNIIIDIDRLSKESSYTLQVEHFFGVVGLAGLYPQPWCDRESKEANKQFPLQQLENATLEDLYHRNSADYKLYNELINCNNQEIQFPNGSLADFV